MIKTNFRAFEETLRDAMLDYKTEKRARKEPPMRNPDDKVQLRK